MLAPFASPSTHPYHCSKDRQIEEVLSLVQYNLSQGRAAAEAPSSKRHQHCISNSSLTLIQSLPEICIQEDYSIRGEIKSKKGKN